MAFGIDLWKIVLESNCSEETERDIKIGLDDLYAKAKAFDEVKEFIIEKLKEEEEEKSRTLLSDYDYGLYQAYDNVDDIIQEYLERD
ncbi:hypothetical protein QI060_00240 [Staphylococcus saprophyticus]|uniref:Uncharacterized protein n=1 Tax=uncultured Caudovirales phage TaxID=2100421 RepID=A0A2H4JG84_9CAUD|nr:hypothetical protein 10F4_11 [uncultured Caudovirales phage]MDW4300734.1 hypothetical protein [Staphylococcus saprophyticus]